MAKFCQKPSIARQILFDSDCIFLSFFSFCVLLRGVGIKLDYFRFLKVLCDFTRVLCGLKTFDCLPSIWSRRLLKQALFLFRLQLFVIVVKINASEAGGEYA